MGLAASVSAKPASKLSDFAGSYQGTVLISTGSSTIAGTTQGSISASKKKERGTISLSSVVSSGGMLAIWAETYSIQNKSLSYLLNAAGTIGAGSASVGVHKKSINFAGSFVASTTAYALSGTFRKSGRHLTLSEIFSGSGTTFVVTYDLRQQNKK